MESLNVKKQEYKLKQRIFQLSKILGVKAIFSALLLAPTSFAFGADENTIEFTLLQNRYTSSQSKICHFSSEVVIEIACNCNNKFSLKGTPKLLLTGTPEDSSGEYQIASQDILLGSRRYATLRFTANCLTSVEATIEWTEIDNQGEEYDYTISKSFGTDFDYDGIINSEDYFPFNTDESVDTDYDGIGNNADTDDDNDGIIDIEDSEPLNAEVGDTQAPIIGDVDALTFEATGEFTKISLVTPEVKDNNLYAPTIKSDLTDNLSLGEHVITWMATDFAGNQATIEQLVTIKDTTKPEFGDQSNISINAEGRLTNINGLVNVTAIDIVDGELAVIIVGESHYQSGVHEIELSVADNSGNNQSAVINLEIKPELTLGSNLTVEAGGSYQLSVGLSGNAPSYPVTIDYQLSKNGNPITNSSETINSGTQGQLTINVPSNALITDNLIVNIDNTSNAFIDDENQTQLLVIENNEAPQLSVVASQNGNQVSIIDPANGMVTITASINDVNQTDSHDINWAVTDNAFTDENNDADNFTFEVDPSSLGQEDTIVIYHINVDVTENNTNDSYSVNRDIQLIIENLASLEDNVDSDGDGINDSDEGYTDGDGDGIADYLDDDDNTSHLPTQEGGEPMKTIQGLSMSLGTHALTSGGSASTGSILSIDELDNAVPEGSADTNDAHYAASSSVYNFIISGLAKQGDSVTVVIPLANGNSLSSSAMYRKYNTTIGWYAFVEDDKNKISSALKDDNGNCPTVNDDLYTLGLAEYDNCVQLTIEDGGPNDADLAVNGEVEDPGVFVIEEQNQAPDISMITSYQVNEDTEFTLDASSTTDAEGDILTFEWRQLSGHEVTLTEINEMILTFVSPEIQFDETLTFELTVNDGKDDSSVVIDVLVSQINQGPTVNIDSHDNSYTEGSVVKLTSQSSDPDGDNLTYLWKQISGVGITFNNEDMNEVSFTLPEVESDEIIEIQLSVTDGSLSTSTTTTLTINNEVEVITVTSENKSSGGSGSITVLMIIFALIRLRTTTTFKKAA